jgi:hypothetical protein
MGTKDSFFYHSDPALLILILFMGMLTLMKLGAYIGHRRNLSQTEPENPGNSTVLAAVFGLFAFLLAFTFSMSGSRYENRRQSIIMEANAIGTAVLRADLYPTDERMALRKDLKTYTQARIEYMNSGRDKMAMARGKANSQNAARLIWQRVTDNAKKAGSIFPANLIIPALNDMFDSGSTNDFAEKLRVPDSIVILLFALCLVCAFFVGYHSSHKGRFDWVIATGFCLLSALVIFITLDLDRPRAGFIQLNTSKKVMTDLLQMFDNP